MPGDDYIRNPDWARRFLTGAEITDVSEEFSRTLKQQADNKGLSLADTRKRQLEVEFQNTRGEANKMRELREHLVDVQTKRHYHVAGSERHMFLPPRSKPATNTRSPVASLLENMFGAGATADGVAKQLASNVRMQEQLHMLPWNGHGERPKKLCLVSCPLIKFDKQTSTTVNREAKKFNSLSQFLSDSTEQTARKYGLTPRKTKRSLARMRGDKKFGAALRQLKHRVGELS
eukprot:TRINITY_DN20364_c0_g1_i7.p1 TRINITY_DN20364_c0_g1~~TRINITY_DN20364_c0_g1_i7.p1  ORF type:complete len:232 (-),score=29.24 TRINITY_DN20364_c0_g1_i7:262-957(-)